MTGILQQLVSQAVALTSPEPVWNMVGGRSCPIGWEDCSQPVFESACGRYADHGERGGPGAQHCATECQHGRQPPPIFCTECGNEGMPCGEAGPCGPWGSVTRAMEAPCPSNV